MISQFSQHMHCSPTWTLGPAQLPRLRCRWQRCSGGAEIEAHGENVKAHGDLGSHRRAVELSREVSGEVTGGVGEASSFKENIKDLTSWSYDDLMMILWCFLMFNSWFAPVYSIENYDLQCLQIQSDLVVDAMVDSIDWKWQVLNSQTFYPTMTDNDS